jgi:hypothetical protein
MVTQAPDFTKVSMGMTKPEVVQALGRPDTMSANGRTEYLFWQAGRGRISGYRMGGYDDSDYFVRLVDGRVDAYGKKGDFDTAQPATQRYDVKVRNTVESTETKKGQ